MPTSSALRQPIPRHEPSLEPVKTLKQLRSKRYNDEIKHLAMITSMAIVVGGIALAYSRGHYLLAYETMRSTNLRNQFALIREHKGQVEIEKGKVASQKTIAEKAKLLGMHIPDEKETVTP